MLDFAYSRRRKMLAFAPAPTRGLSPSTNAGSVPFNTINKGLSPFNKSYQSKIGQSHQHVDGRSKSLSHLLNDNL